MGRVADKTLIVRNGILAAVVFAPAAGAVHAQGSPQLNPMTGQWEMAQSNASLQLNPVTNQWELARPEVRRALGEATMSDLKAVPRQMSRASLIAWACDNRAPHRVGRRAPWLR
jgi:hypothetical protein